MMMAYKSYLKGSGFQMIRAGTTREAEDILDRIQPRAIVLDIVLRSEDTWSFLARLKEDDKTRDIPVLIASTSEDRAKGYHLGVDAYLVKPVERTAILGKLRELTGLAAITRLLIIDDSELDRYLLKQHLRKLPVEIAEATSGADGIRQAIENPPDMIFLDLTMPDANGIEVLGRIRSIRALNDIPVAIVTSRILSEQERDVLMEQAAAVMSKDELSEAALRAAIQIARNSEFVQQAGGAKEVSATGVWG